MGQGSQGKLQLWGWVTGYEVPVLTDTFSPSAFPSLLFPLSKTCFQMESEAAQFHPFLEATKGF